MRSMKRAFIQVLVGLMAVGCADAVFAQTHEVPLTNWQFSRDGGAWQVVTVPHDWAIAGPFDSAIDKQVVRIVENQETNATEKTGRTGSLPWIGRGVYRRRLEIPAEAQWASLVFSGAMSEPEIWLDGKKVGEWKFGYTPFEVELPVTSGGVHELEVRLQNRPRSSRWYPGAGLYRPVALRWGGAVGIRTQGQALHTPDLETLVVTTDVRRPEDVAAAVSYRVLDAAGREVASGASPLKIPKARAWSPEAPYLYTLETRVTVNGEIADVRRDRFGVRTVSYGKDGFRLNGIRRKFKGVCLHHDLGPLGAAFDGDAFRRQVVLLKEMGCDAIRTAHNIPAPEQLAICDELGLMVMAESFDAWERAKVERGYNLWFRDWWRRDLRQLVLSARNHPSVVMWSIGNEIPDQDSPRGAELTQELQTFVHTLDPDPNRLVTQGASRMPAALDSGVIAVMEIPALTYRLPFYEACYRASSSGLMLGAETASTVSSRGVYTFPDEPQSMKMHADGQCSGYDVEHCAWSNLPDDDFAMQDDRDWTIGEFVWTGFDYLGEPTPYDTYAPSRSSYFGILDLAGLPKDRYWLYRARWNRSAPTLHVLPHWTWPGREGKVTPVYVYTSYPSAELFVNGQSQGRRTFDRSSRLDRYRLRWRDVVYEPGEIRVVAYDEQGRAAAEKTVRTAGAFARFDETARDFGRLRFVTVTAVDAQGTPCPDECRVYEVRVPAGWRFKAICNGDATSHESFVVPKMRLFKGRLVYILERIPTA